MSVDRYRFLAAADKIGTQLAREAVWDGKRCNWIGNHMEVISSRWVLTTRSFGPELYSGTAGIALFLGHLYRCTGERIFRVIAEGAIEHVRSLAPKMRPSSRLGFYAGTAGIAWSLRELSKICDRPDWSDEGLQLMRTIPQDAEPWNLDIMSGMAGAVLGLLMLVHTGRERSMLDFAVNLGRKILAAANRHRFGWSWETLPESSSRDLTGLSHGASGISLALLELGRATEESAFITAAERGFEYEDHWFEPDNGNWPDFRTNPGKPRSSKPVYEVAWCHGAPGIGLSRLRAYQLIGNEKYRLSAEAAIGTTYRSAVSSTSGQGNFCLCHGQSGNADLFLCADHVFREEKYRTLAEQIGQRGLEAYDEIGVPWPCGVQGGGETPGLMLGLAGIGYFYLRLFDSAKVPTILLPSELGTTVARPGLNVF
jgi:lantibiotic biosynthesis protein